MSHNLSGRVDRLEWRRPMNGTIPSTTTPAHSFDYDAFERRFRAMAETEPDFTDRWLQGGERRDPA